jgi:hypothetical protein
MSAGRIPEGEMMEFMKRLLNVRAAVQKAGLRDCVTLHDLRTFLDFTEAGLGAVDDFVPTYLALVRAVPLPPDQLPELLEFAGFKQRSEWWPRLAPRDGAFSCREDAART